MSNEKCESCLFCLPDADEYVCVNEDENNKHVEPEYSCDAYKEYIYEEKNNTASNG